MKSNHIYTGDCRIVLKTLTPKSVNLIFTSPPYANKRGGVKTENYVAWFLPIAQGLKHVLVDNGSFILNIKECVVEGERHTYVIKLIQAMREQGWQWVEEYCWHKRNSFPGKWPNRFRDAFERCLHFTKSKHFAMYQEAVMVPIGDWSKSRLKNLSEVDERRDESRVGSGFGKKVANWKDRSMVYPTNVLHLATECGNKQHSAAFPVALPTWFIRLFTKPDDLVLDPFIGSGSTAIAALQENRKFIGIEIDTAMVRIANKRIHECKKTSKEP